MPKRVRVYSMYDKKYQATRKEKTERAQRNKDRRAALKSGKVHRGDNLDIHHPSRSMATTTVRSRSANRADKKSGHC